MKPIQPPVQVLYACPDQRVQVIRKTSGLRRFPPHRYPCVLFLLSAEDGTRVQTKPDGTTEFMPNYDELKSMLIGINPELAAILPDTIRNKPRERQVRWSKRNRNRRNKRSGA